MSVYTPISCLWLQLGACESPSLQLACSHCLLVLLPLGYLGGPLASLPLRQGLSSKDPVCLLATCPPGTGTSQIPVEACPGLRLPGVPEATSVGSLPAPSATQESRLCTPRPRSHRTWTLHFFPSTFTSITRFNAPSTLRDQPLSRRPAPEAGAPPATAQG